MRGMFCVLPESCKQYWMKDATNKRRNRAGIFLGEAIKYMPMQGPDAFDVKGLALGRCVYGVNDQPERGGLTHAVGPARFHLR